jgi:hypothetical protein
MLHRLVKDLIPSIHSNPVSYIAKSTMGTVPLRRLVGDDHWEAEDLAGRLSIVAHAAFLRAGFVPYGDEPSSGALLKQVDEIGPSAPRLSRRYTVAELAARSERADAAALEVRAQGNGGVAFQAYLLTRDGELRCLCEAVLDEDTLAPLLACRVADAARALETADMSLWRPLVDWVFPVLLLELCRRNDLPVTGFASLPDDIKAEILKRLNDGKDLARVECTSKQLRRLVTDCELWKGMCEALGLLPLEVQSSDSSDGLGSWKQRYMEARRRPRCPRLFSSLWDLYDEDEGWFAQSMRQMEAPLQRVVFGSYDDDEGWLPRRRREREANDLVRRRLRVFDIPSPWVHENFIVQPTSESTGFVHLPFVEPEDPLAPPPEPVVAARGTNAGRRRRHRNRPRNDYQKKRHGAGAIHSPSSRYKWKHR